MELAVLDTREVLLEHLLAKVTELCSSKTSARKVVSEIGRSSCNGELLRLLESEEALLETVNRCKACLEEKEELGERLFVKVAELDSRLCAQITGMLLELAPTTIHLLLRNHRLLSDAVEKSKREYIQFRKEEERREEVGGRIYCLVSERHGPTEASRLTGMLLELGDDSLATLLDDPQEFTEKLALANQALLHFYAHRP